MDDERRTSPRVHIAGLRVVYESGNGEPAEAYALDLATGGLFVGTPTPLAVGKRISLEIQVVGEAVPWAALGRVVWSRAKSEGEDAPAGMGVKLIDADDTVLAALARLVARRERTEPGVGQGSTPPPAPVTVTPPGRERTILGVGAPLEETPAAPSSLAAVVSERVSTTPPSAPSPPGPRKQAKPSAAGRAVVILVLLAVAAIAAYVVLDALRQRGHALSELLSPSAGPAA
jgi:uncharacterized protein (TIGR02266 family)